MTAQMQKSPRSHVGSERGAILIQVGIALIVLIAFLAFVVDYGLLWVARRQAQNAADAGALAGAVAMAFDADDRSPTGPAKTAAYNFAIGNFVAGEAPDVIDPGTEAAGAATDVKFYDDAPADFPPECADNSCIRVDVYRNQERTNPLPVWFGQLIGVADQGVRATATARVSIGNATDCLKPWAVIDKWDENYPDDVPWTTDAEFNKYYTSGKNAGFPNPAIDPPDVYIPPTTDSPGTGFHPYDIDPVTGERTLSDDYGRQLVLKVGTNSDFEWGSGWFRALALGARGGRTYKDNIKGCIGVTYKIGDELELDNEPGNKVGPTRQGVAEDADSLVNQDPTAVWDPTLNGGRGGVANSKFAVSPRIVAVPLVNPDLVAEANRGGRTTVPIANIMGFFVEGMTKDNKGVVGRLMTMPGLMAAGGAPIGSQSAFLTLIHLVR